LLQHSDGEKKDRVEGLSGLLLPRPLSLNNIHIDLCDVT